MQAGHSLEKRFDTGDDTRVGETSSDIFDPYVLGSLVKTNYSAIITKLVELTSLCAKAPPDSEHIAAWQNYFVSAITKGVPLESLPEAIAQLTPTQCGEAAEKLPDKEALGYEGSRVSLTAQDRENFVDAAKRRSSQRYWDKIFPEGQTTGTLTLAGNAASSEKKLAEYIRNHNIISRRFHQAAQQTTENSRKEYPPIRRNPDNPSKLMRFIYKKKEWQPWIKLGKFLNQRLEWDLYDLFMTETEAREKQVKKTAAAKASSLPLSFLEIAHHTSVDADSYDPDSFRVVLSVHPQLLGEMSTGQRWTSCMAKEGKNFGLLRKKGG